MMTKIIAAGVLMLLVLPALGATAVMAPKVTSPPASTSVIMPQSQPLPPPGAQSVIALPPPAITSVKPVECVEKGGTIFLQGLNLRTSSGHNIALDDGGGTHIDLTINNWSGTSISATVPNDPRVQEGASYWVAMETGHSQWLGNIDKSITICMTSSSSLEPYRNNIRPLTSGGGSLLEAAMPPLPSAQGLQGAAIKEDVNVEPGEVVVVSANMNEAQQLQQTAQSMGLGIKRRTPLKNLGLVVSVLRVPKGTAVADALSQLRQAMPNAWMDANHRYQLQAGKEVRYANQAISWNPRAGCGAGLRIGLIDTAIDNTLRLFKGRSIMQRSFLATGIVAAASEHGTAIASILVAAPTGLIPDVQLYTAAVFRSRNNKEVDTTAEWVVSALDWLVGEKVEVINMSLGGSRNLLLEAAVERVMKRGIIVVAAAGNGEKDGAPVYPAAQPGVIAVTAVDVNLKPYKHANQGDYIAYAAPGVDVWVVAPGGDGVYATGTSYAVPFVTAVIAATKWSGKANTRVALDRLLQSKAKDLGIPGRDNIFGWGLIQMPGECVRIATTSKGKSKQGPQIK